MRRTPSALTALALTAALAVTACSGDNDDESDGPAGRATSLEEGFSVLGALAELPAGASEGDEFVIRAADLTAATREAGLELPSEGTRDAVGDWLIGLTNDAQGTVHVSLADSFNIQAASPDEFTAVAGWSVLDVESFVELSALPTSLMVVTGDFDGDTLSADLVDVGDGVVSDKEGEDQQVDLAQQSALNRVGVPIRLAQQGHRIAMGTSTPAIESWLDGDATLADDEAYAAIAQALDDEDVVSAVLAAATDGGDPSAVLGDRASEAQLEALEEQLIDAVPKEPFDAVGIGWGVDDGHSEVHVAYHFGSQSAAEASVDQLETTYRDGKSIVTGMPFSDQFQLDDVEADDSVVTVTVTPTDDGNVAFLEHALVQRELLFLSS